MKNNKHFTTNLFFYGFGEKLYTDYFMYYNIGYNIWISIYGYPYMGSQGSLGGIHGYLGGTDGTLGPMGLGPQGPPILPPRILPPSCLSNPARPGLAGPAGPDRNR